MNCVHGGGEASTLFVHGCADAALGEDAGVHALVIATSAYPRSSRRRWFRDIPGTATGASRFAKWLQQGFRSPVGLRLLTTRVLLAPVQEELEFITADGVTFNAASSTLVEEALEAWFRDCDQNRGNVALMYVGGHGLVGAYSALSVFLGDANSASNPYRQSINMLRVREAMARCRAYANVFVHDCCSTDENRLRSVDTSGGIAPEVLIDRDENRKYILTIDGARLGEASYALSAADGTVLSSSLLPLLGTAGDIVDHQFAVTRDRLDDELPGAVRLQMSSAGLRSVTQEPRVRGEHDRRGVHRPEPPPKFDLAFSMPVTHADEIRFVRVRGAGQTTATIEGRVMRDAELRARLEAGEYVLDIGEEVDGIPISFPLLVSRDSTIDVLSGRDA